MQHYKHLFTLILLLIVQTNFAQLGGKYTYAFLNTSTNYRLGAHNGYAGAVNDGSLAIGLYNPTMLNQNTHLKIEQSFVNTYGGAYNGQTALGVNINKNVYTAVGLQYNKYGSFDYANAGGELSGQKFYASDYLLTFATSKALKDSVFKIGAALKTIYSVYETYNSVGLGIDVAGAYLHPNKRLVVTAMVRNAGKMLNKYDGKQNSLPLDMQISIAQKAKHAPFRLVLTAYQLNTLNLIAKGTYKTTDTAAIKLGLNKRNTIKQLDNIARHLNFGIEILLSKNFHVLVSYNHKHRKELAYPFKTALSGFAMGLGIKVKKINIGLAYTNYNVVAHNWSFTLATNLTSWKKKL
jgi:hypothetical protein